MLLAQDPKLQAAYDSYMASQLMSSLTEDEMFAATSALGAVQKAYASNNGVRRPTSPSPGVEAAGPSGASQHAGAGDKDVLAAAGVTDARRKRRSSGASCSDMLGEGLGEREHSVARSGHSGSARPGSSLAGRQDGEAESGRGTPLQQHPTLPSGKVPLLDSDDFGGPPLPTSAAAVAAALALVEVKPLADHIQRDDEHLPPLLGPPPGAPLQPAPPPGAAAAAAAATAGGVGGADVTKDNKDGKDGALQQQDSNNSLGTYDEFGDLGQYSGLRRTCIKLCSNPDFEMVVTAIIFANCVTLCLYDPRQPESSGLNKKLFWAELAFNICFSIEMLLRVVSMGSLLGYIRRPWNQFDSFMVVAGYTVFVPGNSSAVNAIRALRALRPLRTITRFESLRGVIVCFLEAIPLLASVGGLLIFFVFMYAVAAVQLFPKTYHNTCLDPEGVPLNMGEDPDMFGCGGRGHCPANYTCMLLEHQHTVNVAGFDNAGLAMLSVWQALTLTGWVFMMYRTIDTYSLYVVIYYLTLVVIGAYFVLNLFLAVLKIKFAKAQTLFHNQLALQRGKARRNSIMTFMSRVQTKWTEYSSKRSQASSLNSRLTSAISSKMTSVASAGSPRMSHDGKEAEGEGSKAKRHGSKDKLGSEKGHAGRRRGSANGSAYEQRSADGFLPGSVEAEGGGDEVGGARARVEVGSAGGYLAASKGAGSLQASREGTRDGVGSKPEWTQLEPLPRPGSPVNAADRGAARSALAGSRPSSGTPSSRQLSCSSSRVAFMPAPGEPGVRFAGGDDEPGNEGDHPSARTGPRGGGGVRFGDEPASEPGGHGSDPTSPHLGAGEYTHRSSGGQGSATGEIMYSPHEARTGSGLQGPAGGDGVGGAGGRTSSADGLRPAASAELGERTYSAAPSSMGATNVAMIVMSPAEFDEFIADHPYTQRQYLRLQYRVRIFVNHNLFNQFFMLLIFLNTIFLSLEYHNQPDSLTQALNVGNLTLTVLFTIEMVLKLFGLGFWDYIRDGFNIFDALVVTISLLEIVLSSVGGLNAVRALRVLKALRVLRLFKLFRYMQSLRRIGEVLLSAASSFMAIATLLILFWMVFAIVGMHVFGDKDLDTFPWPNFSTFLYSLVATWNVLNLENWQNIMYAVIRQTGYASSLFFVMWIIIGRYIFLTLFLAVTLEAFEAKYDPNAVRMGANKTGISSVLGSLRSGLSSLRSGMNSVRSSMRGSGKGRSPPDSPHGRKGGGGEGPKGGAGGAVTTAAKQPEQGKVPAGSGGKVTPATEVPSNIDDTRSDSEIGRDSEPVPPPSVLRPGIGYMADAQAAAAAAAAGNPEAPRVNLKRMYTIKEWIDTGNFEVLKDGGAKDGAAAPAADGAAAAAASLSAAGAADALKAEPSTARSLKREPSARLTGPSEPVAEGGSNKPARGTSIIDDSAAQSLASSDAAGGNSASGEAKDVGATNGPARPVAEGTETIRPDPTALPPSSSGGGGRSSLTGLRSNGGSPSPTWAGTGSRGRLESINRNIRRSLEGFAAEADEEEGGDGDAAAGPRRHVLRGPSPLGGFAPSSTAAGSRNSASGMAAGSELILTHGRTPAPLRGGGLSPDLMRMAGSFGDDSSTDDDDAKPGAGGPAGAATAKTAAPVLATAGSLNTPGLRSSATTTVTTASAAEAQKLQQQQQQQPLVTVESSEDPLGSFMDPLHLAQPHAGQPSAAGAAYGPAVAATSSIFLPSKPLPAPQAYGILPGSPQPQLSLGLLSEPASGNDVVMATFGDMSSIFAQPHAEPQQPQPQTQTQQAPPVNASRLSYELEGVDALAGWAGSAGNAHRARRSSTTVPRRHGGPAPAAAAEPQAGDRGVGSGAAPGSAEDDHLMALAGELAAALKEQSVPQPAAPGDSDAVAAFRAQTLSAEPSAITTGGAVGWTSASETTSMQPTPRLKEPEAAAAAQPHADRPSAVPALHLERVAHGAPSTVPHATAAAAAAAAASSAFGSSGSKASEVVPLGAASLQDSAHSMSASDLLGSGRRVIRAGGGAEGLLPKAPSTRLPPGEETLQNLDAYLPPGEALSRAATSNLAARDADVKEAAAASGLLADTLGERIRTAAAAARHTRGQTQEEEDELIFGLQPIRGSKDASRRSSQDDGAPRRPGSGRSGRDQKTPSPGPGGGKGDDEDGEDAGRQGDKGPPLQRISESGSVASRADSVNSHVSAGSRASSGGATGTDDDGDEKSDKKRKHFRKKRRASILIEGSGKAFWIWDEDHPWRENTYWLVTHKRFEYTMFAVILANCVTLALENPYIVPGSPLDQALVWSNVGFTVIFGVEALLKSFAYTFTAYIKRVTNQVDFLIVVSSVVEIILLTITTSVGAVSALRVLRAFKPLRLLTRSAGMRLVFKSVTMSLMSMANVSVVCILFFLIFAILGVQLFSGRFYRCNDDTVAGQTECVGNFTDPLTNSTLERHWSNDFPNFDNTGNALLCCFITATLNGYTEIMTNAMSAPQDVGLQPKQFINPGAFFWFFGFIVVCAFTLLNLYVGVIFSQFSKIRMLSETGSAFLTNDQNEWAELTKMVFRLKPPEKSHLPTSRLRRFCYQLVHHKYFDIFILTIILINVGFLAATWYGEPPSYTRQKDLANIVFMSVFAAEAVVKIFALGWMGYIKVSWNKLDFVLLVLGLLDLVVSMLQSNFLRILRVFRVQKLIALVRVARFAQLVKSVKGIQSLFSTLVYSLPAFGNVGALIGLFFFMYAYVGTFLFGKVVGGETLNRSVNFHDFFQSLLVLTRVATGDNWTGVMFDCMVMPPDCDRAEGNCGSYLAIPYFLSFFLIISVILLNLFTAVIIETFEKTHEQEEWKLSPQALEDFVTLWSEYDDGSGTIQPRHLEELLLKLDPPLGLGAYADNKDVLRFVYDLDIPLVNGRVPFHKTAFELVKRCSQATMPEGAIKEQIDRLVDKFFHELTAQDEMLNFSVAITVMKVQRKWRTRMRAAKLRRKNQWRKDRRDAPSYFDVSTNKVSVGEKYEAYRDAQREVAKTWEAAQVASNKKVDKAELARRSEPRWRFNPKYAPPSVVAATTEKTGLLGLGKRAINVNKLVGLFGLRGGLFGDGGDADKGGRPPAAEFPAQLPD
eukprot:XP_001690493.1 voltage-gated Ca2+ channel, alpha subunit [Chlamydomonas reinhardtii]